MEQEFLRANRGVWLKLLKLGTWEVQYINTIALRNLKEKNMILELNFTDYGKNHKKKNILLFLTVDPAGTSIHAMVSFSDDRGFEMNVSKSFKLFLRQQMMFFFFHLLCTGWRFCQGWHVDINNLLHTKQSHWGEVVLLFLTGSLTRFKRYYSVYFLILWLREYLKSNNSILL